MEGRNEIIYNDSFLKNVRKLPKNIQKKLSELLEILQGNVFDPRLHSKPLGPPLMGKYSFRITRDWRVVFMFQEHHIIKLLAVDHRSKIYKRLSKLL